MADESSKAVALLKYPIMVFSILLAMIIAEWALEISFKDIKSVGPEGLTFKEAASAQIAGLEGKLNGAIQQIEELRKQTAPQLAASPQAQRAIFEASQTVSDPTADLAKITTDGGSKQKGYIWIGNYRGGWGSATLGDPTTGRAITDPPDRLPVGSEYTVLGNMVVRDGLPSNDAEYYRSRKSLGVLPRGTKVRLVSAPKGIDREFAVQYWAEVEPS